MKLANRICQILAFAFGAVAFAFFIFPDFAFATAGNDTVGMTGFTLAFGGSLELAGNTYALAKSAQIMFCALLNILGVIFSVLTFKYKALRYAAPAVSLVSAIYMLVKVLSNVYTFVDFRAEPKLIAGATAAYNYPIVIVITAALFMAVILGIAHLLIADRLEVAGTKELTLPKKIVAFFRDYKSEAKKIVWPNLKTVGKNTVIVLLICALIGGFVCLLDFGLVSLVEFIVSL